MRGPQPPMKSVQKSKNFKKSMLQLVRYLKPFIPQIIISLLLGIAGTVFVVLAPEQIGKITTLASAPLIYGTPIDLAAVTETGIRLVCYYVGSALLYYIQSLIMTNVTQKTARSFRTDLDKKINKLPLKYFDTRTYGDVLSRVTNDVDMISQTLNQSIISLVYSVTLVVGLLIMMFKSCPQLALVVLCTVPLSLLILGIMVKSSQKYFRNQQIKLGEIEGHIEETYAGHEVIKAFSAENSVKTEFKRINDELYNCGWKSQFFSGAMQPAMNIVSNMAIGAVCAVGGVLLVNGTISDVGIISAFLMYARNFSQPLSQFAQVLNNLQSTAAASERVFEFLAEAEMESEKDKVSRRPDKIKGRVEFRNVTFGYNPDKMIIKNFSAVAESGQKVAIVGPTGAGKTTLVNLLMRFYEVNSGDILIDGVSVKDMTREDVHELFGMVLQDTWLFEGSIKDNIIYAKENVSDEQVFSACKQAGIDHFIRALPGGYDMILDDTASLSAGQKQLITIARAMVEDAPMLILDEATSSVDTRTEALIQAAMDELTKDRTSFIIAHRLSTIRNADLILVLNDGDIVEQGNHEQLMAKNGYYATLYNSQFENV